MFEWLKKLFAGKKTEEADVSAPVQEEKASSMTESKEPDVEEIADQVESEELK
jgi:hypothetical protein